MTDFGVMTVGAFRVARDRYSRPGEPLTAAVSDGAEVPAPWAESPESPIGDSLGFTQPWTRHNNELSFLIFGLRDRRGTSTLESILRLLASSKGRACQAAILPMPESVGAPYLRGAPTDFGTPLGQRL